MHRRRPHIIFALLGVVLIFVAVYLSRSPESEKPFVNVYDWYGMLSKDIIHQFEQETGIAVRYDVYDSNEILEAKLLATNSGYDVVFPSASPYVARQIQAGIYQKLDKNLLSNLKALNASIVREMRPVDANMDYAIPYYWGTLGILADRQRVESLIPGGLSLGYKLLFDPKYTAKLAPYGISFLEEAIDVLPLVMRYLGFDPHSQGVEELNSAVDTLLLVRPHIKRFTSSRFINDIAMGDVCVAQAWSGESHRAQEIGRQLGRDIVYVIPPEGSTLWIDCIAIPEGAPHPKNAHIFINFLLRPDISAKITNYAAIPTVITAGYKDVDKDIRTNPTIFPPSTLMEKLKLDKPDLSEAGQQFDRLRTRAWARVRLNS